MMSKTCENFAAQSAHLPEMGEWLAKQKLSPEAINPCIRLHGRGPEGQTCKGCVHLFSHWTARRFWKCDLRNYTHGPGSDHKLKWPACAKFEAKTL